MAQKRKDWNGLISGFKASGLTDGSRAVSTKKDPLLELALQEGVFFRFGESNELHCFYLLYFYHMPFPAKVKRCAESLQAPSPSPSVPPLPEGEALAGRVTFHWTPKARIWRKRAGLATEGSSFWTSAPCQAVAGLDSGALPFPRHRALLVQWELDRHAKGSPSGRAVTEGD